MAVAAGFNAEGGNRNYQFSSRSTESDLHTFLEMGWGTRPQQAGSLRAESFYNVATYIDDNVSAYSAASPSMSARTGSRSSIWPWPASTPAASTCSTSPRPPCPSTGASTCFRRVMLAARPAATDRNHRALSPLLRDDVRPGALPSIPVAGRPDRRATSSPPQRLRTLSVMPSAAAMTSSVAPRSAFLARVTSASRSSSDLHGSWWNRHRRRAPASVATLMA